MTGELSQALQTLAPSGFLIGCREIAFGDESALLDAEMRSMASRSIVARRASGAARIVARQLLTQLALPAAAVLRNVSGAPVWPQGVIGSLAHDDQIAVAIIGKTGGFSRVGIDIEPVEPLAQDAVDVVMTASEQRNISDAIERKLLFCAKEAVYKASHPADGEFLEYHDIEVDLPGRQAFARTGGVFELRTCMSSHLVALALA